MRNHVSSPVMRIVVPGATEHERKTHMTLAHDLVTSTSRSVLRGRGKDAMMTDNDDLGHLTHGLELDNVVNDLPHSRPALDDHHLALETTRCRRTLMTASFWKGGKCMNSPLQPP